MSGTPGLPRTRARLRVLVLLLALWVPGAHVQATAAPALSVPAGTAEHDVLDSPLRPPARALHQPDAADRTAPPAAAPAPARPAPGPRPAVPLPPSAVPLLRTVVLRC
ncbi:hypothetical protein [Streptomyces sp. IBSBF 3136]|uniref:hypothetical protein n=1 Tax=Streptomyces sp. IBSBF 3136 TaxID=2903524 RepID=UPI002FDC70C2